MDYFALPRRRSRNVCNESILDSLYVNCDGLIRGFLGNFVLLEFLEMYMVYRRTFRFIMLFEVWITLLFDKGDIETFETEASGIVAL